MNNQSSSQNILLITERDNFGKDAALMESLRHDLGDLGYDILFYRTEKESIERMLDPDGSLAKKSWLVRKVLKSLRLLKHPTKWHYFFTFRSPESISGRVSRLRSYVQTLGKDKNIVILSRSAGGRISSLIADDPRLGIRKLICLGYPFRHPEKSDEPERYQHLPQLKTPLLIVQGSRDSYGGIEMAGKYALSPTSRIEYVDTDHDFVMPPDEWAKVVALVRDFIVS